MIQIRCIFLLLFFAPMLCKAQEPWVLIYGFDDASCGAWVKSAQSPYTRAQFQSWIDGFVSGYNFGNPTNQVGLNGLPSRETVELYVDKYCREKPLSPFFGAAFDLVKELRPRADPEVGKAKAR